MYTYRKESSGGWDMGRKKENEWRVKEKEREGMGGGMDRPCIFHEFTGLAAKEVGEARGRGGWAGNRLCVHLFLGTWAVRGGVTGRPEFTPPYWYLAFFSEGFRICKQRAEEGALEERSVNEPGMWDCQRVPVITHGMFIV